MQCGTAAEQIEARCPCDHNLQSKCQAGSTRRATAHLPASLPITCHRWNSPATVDTKQRFSNSFLPKVQPSYYGQQAQASPQPLNCINSGLLLREPHGHLAVPGTAAKHDDIGCLSCSCTIATGLDFLKLDDMACTAWQQMPGHGSRCSHTGLNTIYSGRPRSHAVTLLSPNPLS